MVTRPGKGQRHGFRLGGGWHPRCPSSFHPHCLSADDGRLAAKELFPLVQRALLFGCLYCSTGRKARARASISLLPLSISHRPPHTEGLGGKGWMVRREGGGEKERARRTGGTSARAGGRLRHLTPATPPLPPTPSPHSAASPPPPPPSAPPSAAPAPPPARWAATAARGSAPRPRAPPRTCAHVRAHVGSDGAASDDTQGATRRGPCLMRTRVPAW